MNTWIWVKPKYTEFGIREIVRIVHNPYNRPASKVLCDWILPEYWYQCYAVNRKGGAS